MDVSVFYSAFLKALAPTEALKLILNRSFVCLLSILMNWLHRRHFDFKLITVMTARFHYQWTVDRFTTAISCLSGTEPLLCNFQKTYQNVCRDLIFNFSQQRC